MSETKLKDLRSNDKNVDLDKGSNMPVKRSGFGPSTAFGGVSNPELTKNSPTEYTPYKMKGHTLPGIKQRGVPFTGGVGSPNKFFGAIGNLFKKKKGGGSGGSLGNVKGIMEDAKAAKAAKEQGTDHTHQEFAQLDETMMGGVGGKLSTSDPMYGGGGDPIANKAMMGHKAAMAMAGGGGGSDPMMLAAGGLGGSAMAGMVKKKKMKTGWGGMGDIRMMLQNQSDDQTI